MRSGAAAAALTAACATGASAQAQPVRAESLSSDSAVAVIVKVPRPWYAPRFVVLGKMRETIPQYRSLPGLAFKAYSFAQADGHYGGVYLWKDLASARAWFSPAWFARVEHERGVPAEVRFFEVLAHVDHTPGRTPADPDSRSVATLWLAPLPPGADRSQWRRQAQATAAELAQVPGLLRRYVVAADRGRVGHISLWRDEASAREWFNLAKGGPGAGASVEWFDTPILLPSALAENPPRVPGL
jgi:heme-degrading monooxygenase HmoA